MSNSQMILSSDVTQASPSFMQNQCRLWARDNPGIGVPDLQSLRSSLLARRFQGRQRQFRALNGSGQMVSHVVARISPTLKCDSGNPIGLLGFFASLNEPDLVSEMLKEAITWLVSQGATAFLGPVNGDTWRSYRFNCGPFDQEPFLMEPTNPDWYIDLWNRAGFRELTTYHSKYVNDISAVVSATKNAYDRAVELGYRFRDFRMSEFETELTQIYELSCQCFPGNFLYEPIEKSDFLELYQSARSIANPKLIKFSISPAGQPVGFLFNVVDYHAAVRSMNGRSGLIAKMRFLLNKKLATAVNFKSIAVSPKHRGNSVAGALMHLGYQATRNLGFQRANLCLIHDSNVSTKLDGGQGSILRRYVLLHNGSSITTP